MTSTTPSGLSAVKLEGSESHIRRVLKDINGRATKIIRGPKGVLYVGVPSSELAWLDTVAKDAGCKKSEISSFPDHRKAPCGVLTTDRPHHALRCKACIALRPKDRSSVSSKASEVIVVARIEPGQDFNLDGIITSLEATREKMFGQLESIESLLTNLKAYRDARNMMVELEQEVKDRLKAVRLLLKE